MIKRLLIIFGFIIIFVIGYLIGISENPNGKALNYYQDIIPIYDRENRKVCDTFNEIYTRLSKYEKLELMECIISDKSLPSPQDYGLKYLP